MTHRFFVRMSNLFAPELPGDGIRFAFFHHLWSKNRGDDTNQKKGVEKKSTISKSPRVEVRLPDTVIFRLGQPLQWYFTSERGGRPLILRKRKKNINVEKIEEDFLRKLRKVRGQIDSSTDIVAYFIASNECSKRNRNISFGKEGRNGDNESQMSGRDQNDDDTCDIEYFNEEALRKSTNSDDQLFHIQIMRLTMTPDLKDNFLYTKRKNQTGILQRFINPSGGGVNNSQIQAICAPKMCVLERRKTKQSLHDARFGLYERAVTFEGPEVYSTSLPIRGAALPGRLREVCNKVLNDISEAAMRQDRTSVSKEDKRMVLNLKVDNKERIWILYSSSIRSLPGSSSSTSEFPSYDTSMLKTGEPLNIENVIKLSPGIKLTQNANHDPNIIVSNNKMFRPCPSCSNSNVRDTFHPVPYKTIISHFEEVMATTRDSFSWPPDEDIIKCAGGVGFGTVEIRDDAELGDKDITIPPVIRHLHPRLQIDGYRQYRSDPLFLHRKCKVCEGCFLAYAKLVSTSFQITRPIKMDTELKQLGFASHEGTKRKTKMLSEPSIDWKRNKDHRESISSSFSGLCIHGPTLPPAIVDPPVVALESDKKKFMPLPYDVIESPNQPLLHLIQMQQKLAVSKYKSKPKKLQKAKNPYAIQMKFVDSPKSSTSRKNNRKRSNANAVHTSEDSEHVTPSTFQTRRTLDRVNLSGIVETAADTLATKLLSRAAAELQANA